MSVLKLIKDLRVNNPTLLDRLNAFVFGGQELADYEPTRTYNRKDLILFKGVDSKYKTLKCKNDNVTGPFSIDDWEESMVAGGSFGGAGISLSAAEPEDEDISLWFQDFGDGIIKIHIRDDETRLFQPLFSTTKATVVTFASNGFTATDVSAALEELLLNKIEKSLIGQNSGVAPLNSDGIIPSIHIASTFKEIRVVNTIADRNNLETYEGLRAHVKDATADSTVDSGWAEYLHDGISEWTKTAEKESIDIILDWSNIQNRPASSVSQIDSAVANSHVHANKGILDGTQQSFTTALRDKLVDIEPGADVNQNAFSRIKVAGQNDVIAAIVEAILTLAAGNGLVITTDNASKTITIAVADGTTATKGIVQLSSATNSTSATLAATASAVKAAYDLANAALPKTGGDVTGKVNLNIGTGRLVLPVGPDKYAT